MLFISSVSWAVLTSLELAGRPKCFHANHYNFTASASFTAFCLYLCKCVLASRSLRVGVVLPLWQPEGVLEGAPSGWVGWADWLLAASLFGPASFSLARPLCSARRISKPFFRPGTVRRWVKECVCVHRSIIFSLPEIFGLMSTKNNISNMSIRPKHVTNLARKRSSARPLALWIHDSTVLIRIVDPP